MMEYVVGLHSRVSRGNSKSESNMPLILQASHTRAPSVVGQRWPVLRARLSRLGPWSATAAMGSEAARRLPRKSTLGPSPETGGGGSTVAKC